jgi:putative MATE family efflux protein
MTLRSALRRVFKDRDDFELTEGPIGRPLFYLSLPIVVTMLLQTAYNLADTFWLGRYSTEALAGISFAFPMVFLLISIGMGVSVAGSVLVAQHTGAGEPREAAYAAAQTVAYAVLLSLVLGSVGAVVVDDFLALMGAGPGVLAGAASYMRIVSIGLFLMFGFFVFISLMRGYGDTITPMLVMLGTVILNIALDPFVIFGWGPFPELGITGAALATVFSRGVAAAVGLWIMVHGDRGVTIHLRDLWPDPDFGARIARVGGPASIETTSRALSVNLLLFIVGSFSYQVEAAFGVGTRVFSTIFLPAVAVAQGVETMTGQNVGAGKEDRAARTNDVAALAMFLILSGMGVLVFLFAAPIVAVFTPDATVIEIGASFLRFVAPSFGFMGVMRAYSGGFRGTGRTLTAAAIAVATLGAIRLPVAYYGALAMGPDGIWLSFAVSNVAGAAVALAWFRRGSWRGSDLTGPPEAAAPVADEPGDD